MLINNSISLIEAISIVKHGVSSANWLICKILLCISIPLIVLFSLVRMARSSMAIIHKDNTIFTSGGG